MHLPQKGRFEYNLNTWLLVFGIISGVATTGATTAWYAAKLDHADTRFSEWILRHESTNKERQSIVDSNFARLDERINSTAKEVNQIQNLAYRVTVNEQAVITITNSLKELQGSLNLLAQDSRVMRTILERATEEPAARRR